ncbi:MAG: protein phosphatase 2C domain-containing protein [Spirochaetaceae bacterium]|jgi:serine/threonine protein phosphatase PrpC|nr:protein phosphatase 2C domain-containing protein [Spirochaetaceae bacterium]
MPFKSFSVTETGISHTKHGKGCEDFSLHYPSSGDKSAVPVTIAVVADGHGDENCFRSAKGSEFAAVAAQDAIIEFVNRLKPGPFQKLMSKQSPLEDIEKYIHDLVKHIIMEWHGKVEKDYIDNPVTDEEMANVGEKYQKRYAAGKDLHHAYGTTLIAAAITKDYWFGIHIGDGRFTALYPDGTFAQPVPWDDRCYLNVTTSVCDDDALEGARTCYTSSSDKLPAAVFLCSDGVDDNYPVEENEKHLYRLYRTIALAFADDGFDSTCGQLKDLANSFATKGKGDDTSIAGIINLEAVKAIAPLLRKQAEEDDQKAAAEKAAKTEEARIAAEKAAAERVARAAAEKTTAEKAEAARRAVETARAKAETEKADAARRADDERANAAKPAAESIKQAVINNALSAIEAYKKNMSGSVDSTDYGDFVPTNGTIKIEVTIKEEKS